ncbi:probable pseudouridine-5'-phosphatase [Drosophila ficusphila]|uniref:probable pseudouridine-5'-phosphatase n=1 Tax=Drosophila ficusphila TaxID=30025 RepID=UPI0007E7EA8B|nr:probable pseudouridine-5'-phosphatase [Drosophila ficusphila]
MCSPCCKSCKPPPECSRCPPMCCSPGVSYCIFDLESAVFDTRHVYQRALIELASSYNRTIPEYLLIKSGPMETAEMVQMICRKCDFPVAWETFRFQLNERTSDLIANPTLMPGVERLVTHLRKCCMGLGLITSCSESMYCTKIRDRLDFFENFSTVICGNDPELRALKPEPDVYLIALSRLGDAGPDCTLVFDGTPHGVQAASDARLPVVMLAEKSLPCCWSELATLRMETFEEFVPEEFNIPPYSCTEPPPRKSKTSSRRSSQKSVVSRRSSELRRKAAEDAAADEGEEEDEGEEAA